MADEKRRATLIVTSMATERVYNENPVISFKARIDGQTEELGYETWGRELVDQVKKDARLDCEITDIPKDEGVIHRVTQMFDARGNPIKKTTQRASSPGRSYGKTDEQVRVERISTEGQTAYNGIIELRKTNMIKEEAREIKTALDYAEMKMRASMQAPLPPKEVAKKEAPPAKAAKEPSKAAPEYKVDDMMIAQLTAAAKANSYTQEEVNTLLKRFNVEKARDLTKPQSEALLELLKKGEGHIKQPGQIKF